MRKKKHLSLPHFADVGMECADVGHPALSTRDGGSAMRVILTVLVSVLAIAHAIAQTVRLDTQFDTIQIPLQQGDTVLDGAATFEARIFMNSTYNGAGTIFREWQFVYMDRSLSAGPSRISAHLNGLSASGELTYTGPLSFNRWHHIAYVYDGSEDRLYLDGVRVAQRANSGNPPEHNPNSSSPRNTSIGSAAEGGSGQTCTPSFRGYVDWVQISSIARYAEEFCPPESVIADGSTWLLYQFNDPVGSSSVHDDSSRHRDGLVGFSLCCCETSPLLGTLPSNVITPPVGDADCSGFINNFDIDAFVVGLTQGAASWLAYQGSQNCAFECVCDTNQDGSVNNADIDSFVELLFQ
ncbi:MAG: LamG domain-containing protein [Phycisphaerales bacterium]|nr:LamG domain-containing protein [Phycisphaerales bacterium]